MNNIDDHMVRRVLRIQSYDFKILFIESRINIADCVSRWDEVEGEDRDGVYREPFLQGRILNGYGQPVPLEILFCNEMKNELNSYFSSNKRQSHSHLPTEDKKNLHQQTDKQSDKLPDSQSGSPKSKSTKQTCKPRIRQEEQEPPASVCTGSRSSRGTSLSTISFNPLVVEEGLDECMLNVLPAPTFRAQHLRSKHRRAEKRWLKHHRKASKSPTTTTSDEGVGCTECGGCQPIGQTKGSKVGDHCRCICRRNHDFLTSTPPSISMVGLTDDDVERGREETLQDVVSDDVLETQEMPIFDDETSAKIKEMQTDVDITEMISYVSGEKEKPDKHGILLLSTKIQSYFRHFRLFRLTNQGILLRQWTLDDGEVRMLLVVSDEQFGILLRRTHEFLPSTIPNSSTMQVVGPRQQHSTHAGIRRTMLSLGKSYYCYKMREKISDYIKLCAVCVANNHPRGNRDKQGLQAPMQTGLSLAIDFCGPWRNGSSTPYLFCGIDQFSRYAFVYPTKSTKDTDVVASLSRIREEWAGLPKRLYMDGALCQRNSISTHVMKAFGVEMVHTLANNSRSNSRVERHINTICRIILKLQTSHPDIAFNQLVKEARTTYNNTSTDILKNRSPSELHFFRANANVVDPDGQLPINGITGSSKSVRDMMRLRASIQRDVLVHDVGRFMAHRKLENAVDYDSHIKIGDFCWKKRTSFLPHASKKAQWRISELCYEVVGKLATNSFKCRAIQTGELSIIAGDLLVKISLPKEKVERLVNDLAIIRRRSDAVASAPLTRSRSNQPQPQPQPQPPPVAIMEMTKSFFLERLFE